MQFWFMFLGNSVLKPSTCRCKHEPHELMLT